MLTLLLTLFCGIYGLGMGSWVLWLLYKNRYIQIWFPEKLIMPNIGSLKTEWPYKTMASMKRPDGSW